MDLGLTKEGKQELALALILWKDFKKGDWFTFSVQMFQLAEKLGVREEVEDLLKKLPPFDIKPRQ